VGALVYFDRTFMALKKFPGFIDPHVHLREPGATHKEDFYTGSRAAAKGGFTFVIDMPNNPTPTISSDRLNEKIKLADGKAIIDIGFHYGTNGLNTETFKQTRDNSRVFGLKLYCNHTTGEMLIEDLALLEKVFLSWESTKPILVHAEGVQLAAAITLAELYSRKLHICHISQAIEVELVRRAKQKKLNITAGTCPHYLFMTASDREKLKGYATMKPPLGTKADQDALWQGLSDGTIDLIETDHAPHTKEEKEKEAPNFGITGLESAVGLMFKAVNMGKIKEKDIVRLMHDSAKSIFNIPDQENTYVELDPDKPYILGEDDYETKCGWSPFNGWELYGKIEKVVFKSKAILVDGKI
jgi:dihydroorotase-like cyclic amidohydrolase